MAMQASPNPANSFAPRGLEFVKYQALGNDYLVVSAQATQGVALEALARRLCDRRYGAGADGLLVVALEGGAPPFAVRIFNPDGSEAEKSGNGLRILARYLYDQGLVGGEPFTILTPGGKVQAQVEAGSGRVIVHMGRAVFDSRRIPARGKPRQVVNEPLQVGEERLWITALSLGNPHCVVFVDDPTPELARRLGAQIERHPLFPRRVNVQFVRVVDEHTLRIEIWERGAGYTLASGSSACAASAAARKLGLCQAQVNVQMPGGTLEVRLNRRLEATLIGGAERVYAGVWLG